MKNQLIKIGYEIETGKEVQIKKSHIVVTGVTQESGKTTTVEALIKRSGQKAIIFKTKVGEKSIRTGTKIAPFFKDKSDYDFVKGLIETYSKEKLSIEKGTLMRLCKDTSSLIEIQRKIEEKLSDKKKKLRGIVEEIYTRLQHYLENLVPQIQHAKLSRELIIYEGINIMDVERFGEEVQALIIGAVLDEVLIKMKNVIVVIPEAWKFCPQKYGSPCKRSIQRFIRQGATNNNYLYIDSQDMAGVDKDALKQVATWILGYQSEINEVKHTINQIPLSKTLKPKPEDIMTLKIGHFFLATKKEVRKIYVQPSWIVDKTAKDIALGKIDVETMSPTETLVGFADRTKDPIPSGKVTEFSNDGIQSIDDRVKKEIIELRQDFFEKQVKLKNEFYEVVQDLKDKLSELYNRLYKFESQQSEVDINELVSKVMQKIELPSLSSVNAQGTVNQEEIVQQVLMRMPKTTGGQIFKVSPLKMMKREHLKKAKDKILEDINNVSENEKKALKYIESREVDVANTELITKCFFLKVGGSSNVKISNITKSLESKELLEKTSGGRNRPYLKRRIKSMLEHHDPEPQEIDEVYNHIIFDLLENKKEGGA